MLFHSSAKASYPTKHKGLNELLVLRPGLSNLFAVSHPRHPAHRPVVSPCNLLKLNNLQVDIFSTGSVTNLHFLAFAGFRRSLGEMVGGWGQIAGFFGSDRFATLWKK